jgi:hypothetical protein
MKLNITNSSENDISGYLTLYMTNGNVDLKDIVAHSCTEILFLGQCDNVPYDKLKPLLADIVMRLRLNGKILLSGTNIYSITRHFLSEIMSEQEFSDIISNIKSCHSRFSVIEILKELNLSIDSAYTKGNIYEITATRK